MSDVVAIVPARGGSKSIPRKNLRMLAGHPLLAYSVEAGRAARSVASTLVSTDDDEIRRAALDYGAEAPFLRPPALAGDLVPDQPVFEHALRWLSEERGRVPDIVVQLRPTSPLRDPEWVDQAVALLRADALADSVRAVTAPSQNPYKMWRLRGPYLEPLMGELEAELFNAARQSLPLSLWQTGHVDAFRVRTLREHGSLTGRRILPLFVDPLYAVDIDTLDQWRFAEWLLETKTLDVVRPGQPASAAGRPA